MKLIHITFLAILIILSPLCHASSSYPTADIVSVHPNLGQLQYELPLYTIDDQDFTWPISISYMSDGYKPLEYSYPIGYGWSLNAAGSISRQLISFADDFTAYTNTNTLHETGLLNYFRSEGLNRAGMTIKTSIDIGSDVYSFSFSNHSGNFIITGANQVKIISGDFVKVDISELALQSNLELHNGQTSVRNPSSIVITTMDGYKYYFGGDPAYLECTNLYSGTSAWLPYISSWLLNRAEAPNGACAQFYYTKTNNRIGLQSDISFVWARNNLNSTVPQFLFSDTLDISIRPQYDLLAPEVTLSQHAVLDSIRFNPSGVTVRFSYESMDNRIYSKSWNDTGIISKPFLSQMDVVCGTRKLQQWNFEHSSEIVGSNRPVFLSEARNLVGEHFFYEYNTEIEETSVQSSVMNDFDLYGYAVHVPEYGTMISSTNSLGTTNEYFYQSANPSAIRMLQVEDNYVVTTRLVQMHPQFCNAIRIDSTCVKGPSQMFLAKKYHYRRLPPNLSIGSINSSASSGSGILNMYEAFWCEDSSKGRFAYQPFQKTKRESGSVNYTHVWETVYDNMNKPQRRTLYQYAETNLSLNFGNISFQPDDEFSLRKIIELVPYVQYNAWFSNLVSKKLYEGAAVKAEENNTYSPVMSGNFHLRMDSCYWKEIPYTQLRLTNRMVTRYEQEGPIVNELSFEHDNYGRILKSTERSGSDVRFRRFVYVDNLFPADMSIQPLVQDSLYKGLRTLVDMFVVGEPVEQYEGYEQDGVEYVTSGQMRLYKIAKQTVGSKLRLDVTKMNYTLYPESSVTNYVPIRIGTGGLTFNPYYDMLSLSRYTRWNRLTYEKVESTELPTQYTWSADGYMPVSKEVGNNHWTYTYIPYVGITSQQDPRGLTLYYQYDYAGRLRQTYYIENGQKCIINQIEYK